MSPLVAWPERASPASPLSCFLPSWLWSALFLSAGALSWFSVRLSWASNLFLSLAHGAVSLQAFGCGPHTVVAPTRLSIQIGHI